MGTYKRGILGSFSGKIGTVIGGYWRGITYMRAIPEHVTDPKTPAQQLQRAKFGLMMTFLRKIKPVLQVGFDAGGSYRTAFNSAASYNLKNAVKGTLPDLQIDFAALAVTRGILMPAEEASAASENPGEVTISWTSDVELGSASPDDEAVILLYNTSKDRALYIVEGGPQRSEESYTVTVPRSHQGDTLQVYLSFVTADREEVSDSEYLGSVTVAEEQSSEV